MSRQTGRDPRIGPWTRLRGYRYHELAGLLVILLALFVPLAAWVSSGHALPLDQAFHRRLSQSGNRTLAHLAWLAVDIASAGAIVGPLTVLCLFAARHRRRAVVATVSEIGAVAMNLALKGFIHRTRPGEAAPAYLFPSTHMVLTVVAYGMIAGLIGMHMRKPLRRLIAWVMICLVTGVGLSLIYLDLHYLTDVIGGLLIGGAWLCVSLAMLDRVAPKSR